MTSSTVCSFLKVRLSRAGSLLLTLIALLVVGGSAHASCTFPPLAINALPLTLDVARDHFEIGSIISETTSHSVSAVCTELTDLTAVYVEVMFPSLKIGEVFVEGRTYGVYGTAKAAPIGMILEVSIGGSPWAPFTLDPVRTGGQFPTQDLPFNAEIAAGLPYDISFRTRLVAMAPIALSTTYSFSFAGFSIRFKGPQLVANDTVSIRISHAVTVNAASCSLTNADQTIAMRPIAAANFDGTGQTFHETPFELLIDCPPTSTGIDVWATFSDASNPGNVTSHLTLTGNQPAKGVAIELVNGTTRQPILLGPDSSAKNNPNQFPVSFIPTGGSSLSVPFTARYVQTEPVVVPGAANASATVTLSYQ